MIPLRLKLRDFLSYADPGPIDFTGFGVACLTGENGAGKSALLDAITWSLFGAARGCEGGQNQDRLIRDGADEVSVDFEFSLNDSRYRVVRKRNSTGRAELRFMIEDGDGWRNIAGETLRETDARIASTLRMDYTTFTASALFVQGRAENFLAHMRPDERKEVFARLLDLGAYESLEEAARAAARQAQSRREEHSRRVEELAPAAAEAEEATAALERAEQMAHDLETACRAAAEEVERRRETAGALEKAEALLGAERAAASEAQRNLAALRRLSAGRTEELSELDELLSRSQEVDEAHAELERLRDEEAEARKRQSEAQELLGLRSALTERVEGHRKVLEERLAERRRQMRAMEKQAHELSRWEADLRRTEETLAAGEDPRPAIDQTRALASEQLAEQARLGEELRTLETSIADVKERTTLLRRGEGECPVCGGTLDDAHRRRVEVSLRSQASAFTERRRTARAALETARKEAARCKEELVRLERALSERDKLLSDRETLAARIEHAGRARESLAEAESSAAEDARILAEGSFAAEERREIEELTARIAGLYEPGPHEALRARIADLDATYGPLRGRLEQASRRRRAVSEELADLGPRTSAAEVALAERERAFEALSKTVAGLPAARVALRAAERDLEASRSEATQAAAEAARLTERVEAARRAAADHAASAASEREAAARHRRYRRLTEAFGRGGIPDLIIDNARPDLETDANEILGRLTDYEMSVHFAMQRGTRSGKTKETFDVLVHHDGGVRDFAMFSGGEAFRIAFAVRLALSKLLVRRAGARLETLVIDEGFGTQDPQGRERLVEAVELARREFAKVLVITHLDDLKDAFGAQIRVRKDADLGSVVQVVTA